MRGKIAKRLRRETEKKVTVGSMLYREYEKTTSTRFFNVNGKTIPKEVTLLTLKNNCLRKMYKETKRSYLIKIRSTYRNIDL